PLWHVSLCVQALPSLQAVPLAAAGLEHCPVEGLQVPATWHWSEAGKAMGWETTQVPIWQVSVCVQASPSVQVVPFAAAGFELRAVEGLHGAAPWHGSEAVQTTGLEPAHVPFWQVSVCVQALPSLQVVPLTAAGFEQLPVEGSQVPATWH